VCVRVVVVKQTGKNLLGGWEKGRGNDGCVGWCDIVKKLKKRHRIAQNRAWSRQNSGEQHGEQCHCLKQRGSLVEEQRLKTSMGKTGKGACGPGNETEDKILRYKSRGHVFIAENGY